LRDPVNRYLEPSSLLDDSAKCRRVLDARDLDAKVRTVGEARRAGPRFGDADFQYL
jgi:hypothetical protein